MRRRRTSHADVEGIRARLTIDGVQRVVHGEVHHRVHARFRERIPRRRQTCRHRSPAGILVPPQDGVGAGRARTGHEQADRQTDTADNVRFMETSLGRSNRWARDTRTLYSRCLAPAPGLRPTSLKAETTDKVAHRPWTSTAEGVREPWTRVTIRRMPGSTSATW